MEGSKSLSGHNPEACSAQKQRERTSSQAAPGPSGTLSGETPTSSPAEAGPVAVGVSAPRPGLGGLGAGSRRRGSRTTVGC